MADYGVTPEGFVPKTLEVVKADLEDDLRASLGAGINLAPQSVLGQIVGIVADQLADLWDALMAVYESEDPDAAEFAALEKVCAITGTLRALGEPSTGVLDLTGDPDTEVPTGSQASAGENALACETTEDATIAAATDWETGLVVATDEVVTNLGHVYRAQDGGVTALVGDGPDSTDYEEEILDGSVTWRYLGEGTGVAESVPARATENGARDFLARTVTTIETPVSGWSGVLNPAAFDLGKEVDTDAELRIRRLAELFSSSAGPADVIRESLLAVDNVESASVYENDTDTTDADGVPPHSIECVVLGGDDAEVASAIYKSKCAGTGTYGSTTESVDDSEGNPHDVNFSRPDEIPIYVELDVVKDPDTFPDDGEDQIKELLAEFVADLSVGRDLSPAALVAMVYDVQGVLDVPVSAWLVDDETPPVASDLIVITSRQLATLSPSNIAINLIDGTP